MNKTPLLLALILAAAPLSAAAQSSDDAFASALDGITKAAAPQFAQLRAVPKGIPGAAAKAGKAPATADAKAWQKAIEAVKKDGKFTPGQLMTPSSFSLEETTGDVKADHVVTSIAFMGSLNDDEQFEAEVGVLMTRTYKLGADGNMTVEIWGMETDVYGEVQEVTHGTMIQGKDGKPVAPPATDKTLTPASPQVKTQFDAMVQHWAK